MAEEVWLGDDCGEEGDGSGAQREAGVPEGGGCQGGAAGARLTAETARLADGDVEAPAEVEAQAAAGAPARLEGVGGGGVAEVEAGRVRGRVEARDGVAGTPNPSQARRKRRLELETFPTLRALLQASNDNREGSSSSNFIRGEGTSSMSSAGAGRARVVRLAEVAAEGESGRCAKRARGEGGRARVVRWEGGRWLVEDTGEDAGGEGSDGGRRDGNGDGSDRHSDGGDTGDGATVDSGEREERRRGVWECDVGPDWVVGDDPGMDLTADSILE